MQALRLLIQCPFDVDAALRDRQGAKLRGVGAKLVERHRDGDDGTRCHPDIGARNREFRLIGIIEGFGGAADDRAQICAAPSCLQEQIVRSPKREQAALDGVLRVPGFGQVAQALRDDGADGCERILDAMVQLLEDQLLQLVGRLALASMPAVASKLCASISACASRSRRLTFSAASSSWYGVALLAGRGSVRRSASDIADCITIGWVPH